MTKNEELALEEMKRKLRELEEKYHKAKKEDDCPHCGRCKHCGRGPLAWPQGWRCGICGQWVYGNHYCFTWNVPSVWITSQSEQSSSDYVITTTNSGGDV